MTTKKTSLMTLALVLVSLSVFGAAHVESPETTVEPVTADPAAALAPSLVAGVVTRPVSTAQLCEEGQAYWEEQRDICHDEYVSCLSGEDPDGAFELDDHCDSAHRTCLRFARLEAEDLCCPDTR